MKNMWKSAIMGVVVGDALGCPVQFETRAQVAQRPVEGMIGHRTFDMPVGTWTDDSALTLALLDSIAQMGKIDLENIMHNFVLWLEHGMYTPYGFSFDIGRGTMQSIKRFEKMHNVDTCGGSAESDNGNGSIMRIMPAVLYCIERDLPVQAAIDIIHSVSGLTHAHIRAQMACGLYYFMAKSITENDGTLVERLQKGLDNGFAFYKNTGFNRDELSRFDWLLDLSEVGTAPVTDIKSTGYVVDTIEAAVWGLVTTHSFKDALLKIVNLGGDTDSIAAVAGGLAGLYYGYDAIPGEWLDVIRRRKWIEDMIRHMDKEVV